MLATERLNKVLAQSGLGSRRSCDLLIQSGRITVNDKPATLGQKIGQTDSIKYDGKIINRLAPTQTLIAFNKPRGVPVTKKDKFAPVTVMDYLPRDMQHLYPVGRLDKLSSGLLLFTNNGQLALKLTHPRYEHEKEYLVSFQPYNKTSKPKIMNSFKLLTTTIIDDTAQTHPIEVKQLQYDESTQIGSATIILTEGKNRQIRRLLEAIGLHVTNLDRVRIGRLKLGSLKPGEHKKVNADELKVT